MSDAQTRRRHRPLPWKKEIASLFAGNRQKTGNPLQKKYTETRKKCKTIFSKFLTSFQDNNPIICIMYKTSGNLQHLSFIKEAEWLKKLQKIVQT